MKKNILNIRKGHSHQDTQVAIKIDNSQICEALSRGCNSSAETFGQHLHELGKRYKLGALRLRTRHKQMPTSLLCRERNDIFRRHHWLVSHEAPPKQ